MPLSPIITNDGLAAVFNADNDGLSANITHVAFGDTAWTPTAEATQLQNERNRVTISNGTRLQPNQIHLTAIENGDTDYWIREIGFFLEDGTLLAVWSESDAALAFKAAGVDVLLAFDVLLSALPENSVEIVGTGGVNLPPATTSVPGLMRFATTGESQLGVTPHAAVTPQGVRIFSDARYSRLDHVHSWQQITDRPTTFPASSHRHNWTELDGRPTTFFLDRDTLEDRVINTGVNLVEGRNYTVIGNMVLTVLSNDGGIVPSVRMETATQDENGIQGFLSMPQASPNIRPFRFNPTPVSAYRTIQAIFDGTLQQGSHKFDFICTFTPNQNLTSFVIGIHPSETNGTAIAFFSAGSTIQIIENPNIFM